MPVDPSDQLPPLVVPPEPVAVEVLHDGAWHCGFVMAWRGDRVQVRYATAPGMQYSHWRPASEVRRV